MDLCPLHLPIAKRTVGARQFERAVIAVVGGLRDLVVSLQFAIGIVLKLTQIS